MRKPHISILTPSLNQGRFIEETIKSVLSQDYPSFEHIVIDGGSTDETLDILRYYQKIDDRLRFISEPDRGQSHAINKGLKLVNGDIVGWLNSDDTYCRDALTKAANAFQTNSSCSVIYGKAYITNEKNEIIRPYPVHPFDKRKLFNSCFICQPAAFIKKSALIRAGGVDEDLQFCMDYDLWIRLAKMNVPFGFLNEFLAHTRFYRESKTGAKLFTVGFPEIIKTLKKHYGSVSKEWLTFFLTFYRHQGAAAFLAIFKQYDVFGKSPKISGLESLCAKKTIYATIDPDPSEPVYAILLKGELEKISKCRLSVICKGKTVFRSEIQKSAHEHVIPITLEQSETIELHFNRPHFLFKQLLPLSRKELDFYLHFKRGTKETINWIQQAVSDGIFKKG